VGEFKDTSRLGLDINIFGYKKISHMRVPIFIALISISTFATAQDIFQEKQRKILEQVSRRDSLVTNIIQGKVLKKMGNRYKVKTVAMRNRVTTTVYKLKYKNGQKNESIRIKSDNENDYTFAKKVNDELVFVRIGNTTLIVNKFIETYEKEDKGNWIKKYYYKSTK
jgi:hypothetical protein